MPIYPYNERNSKKTVEILRSFEDYKVPPTLEEALKAGLTEEEYANADWQKVIGRGIRVTRGDNWTGSKGNW